MRKWIEFAVIGLFQYVFIQLIAFIGSMLVSPLIQHPEETPWLFVLFLFITFSIGVFLAGWLALKFKWLNVQPRLFTRLLGTLLGALIPLLIGLLISRTLEAGNPAFFIAMAASILGFHLPTWLNLQSA
jgi:hypothetical protein